MTLFRKIGTAVKVLKNYGFKETLGLAGDNFSHLFRFLGRKIASVFYNINAGIISLFERKPGYIHVLYITSKAEATLSQTIRYRIHNVRQALKGKAYTRLEIVEDTNWKNKNILKWADIIVFMRTVWSVPTENIIKSAKKMKIPVVFDIDDIIFLKEYAKDYCKVLDKKGKSALNRYTNEFGQFEKTFRLCNYATASTPFIAQKMKLAGRKAFVIHNGLNKTQLDIAKKSHRVDDAHRSIGYLSGTKTHDKDFEQAAGAIVRILNEYPDVNLRVAGYLDISILPKELENRVIPACYMSWQRLMKYGAQNYINLAPLDIDNPFCHAKSELKYFEAAAVGVPTVASSTDTFSRAIENGENGMLASNEEEWYNALKKLLDDKEYYEKISANAKAAALRDYSPEKTAEEALLAYKSIIDDYKSRKKN